MAGKFNPVSTSASNGEPLTGVFLGPVRGLGYQTPTQAGLTDERGRFCYRPGEAVTFLVGRVVLGTTKGAPRVSLAQLVIRVAGNIDKLHDPAVTNLARFVLTLDQGGDLENGVTIAPTVHEIIGTRVIPFDNPPVVVAAGLAGQDRFDNDPVVADILKELNSTPGVFTAKVPRKLCIGTAARNVMRRDIRGIIKTTDVKIPMRDGSYVCADVFRPAEDGKYPVIMNMSFYGKSFYHECICTDADEILKEDMEDRYFSGNPEGLQCENHESVNTAEWVPNGYVVIRIDSRGVCKSPGQQAPLSRQEAEDYFDAIEWARRAAVVQRQRRPVGHVLCRDDSAQCGELGAFPPKGDDRIRYRLGSVQTNIFAAVAEVYGPKPGGTGGGEFGRGKIIAGNAGRLIGWPRLSPVATTIPICMALTARVS